MPLSFAKASLHAKLFNHYSPHHACAEFETTLGNNCRTYVQPTAWRKNQHYVFYYHNWTWTIVTGGSQHNYGCNTIVSYRFVTGCDPDLPEHLNIPLY